MVIVPVYFDYASPLCYIAWRIAAQLEAELDVRMNWRPVCIAAQHPESQPGECIDHDARARIERVSRETGIGLRIPDRWLDSQAALDGAVFAEECGSIAAYHGEVFAAAYERGDDIGDRMVLVRAAVTAGLPMGRFMEAVATRQAAPQLARIRDEAQQVGVAGYPTFLLGAFPLSGIQPFTTMKLLVARHLERAREGLR